MAIHSSESTKAMQVGTQVDVEKLFHHIPVRKQLFLKTAAHICKKMRDLVIGFALLLPHIRISLKFEESTGFGADDSFKNITKSSLATTMDAIRTLFGNPITKCLTRCCHEEAIPADTVDGPITQKTINIEAILPRQDMVETPIVWRSQADHCFIYINYRRTTLGSDSTIKEICSRIRKKCSIDMDISKYPYMWVHIQLPVELTDVNIEPDKTTVRLQYPEQVLKGIDFILEKMYPSSSADPSVASQSEIRKTLNSTDQPPLPSTVPSDTIDLNQSSFNQIGNSAKNKETSVRSTPSKTEDGLDTNTCKRAEPTALERLIFATTEKPPLQPSNMNIQPNEIKSLKRPVSSCELPLFSTTFDSVPKSRLKKTSQKRESESGNSTNYLNSRLDAFLKKSTPLMQDKAREMQGTDSILVQKHLDNPSLVILRHRYQRLCNFKHTQSTNSDDSLKTAKHNTISAVGLVSIPNTDLSQSPCVAVFHNGQLWIVNITRLEETVLYHVLCDSFQIQSQDLETPILLTRDIICDDALLEWIRGLPRDSDTSCITDHRINSNGFKMKWDTESDIPIVTSVNTAVKSLGTADLMEILGKLHRHSVEPSAILDTMPHQDSSSYHRQENPIESATQTNLAETRPQRILLYFKDRARLLASMRIQKIESPEKLKSEAIVACKRLLRLSLQTDKLCYKIHSSSKQAESQTFDAALHCPHNCPIFAPIGSI
ncbi:ATP-binding mismatch repair protein [Batrachochytrium dendrobatidis]|nr:ATP-binding mismatch repair protein [Batrachochytrium dendrobatidis]